MHGINNQQLLRYGFLFGILCWSVLALLIHYYGRQRSIDVHLSRILSEDLNLDPVSLQFDAIIVAGFGIDEDLTPSRPLRRRIELGVHLYKKGLAPYLIFTGGIPSGLNVSEAEVSLKYALKLIGREVERGTISEDAMILEGDSLTTTENAKFARRRLEERLTRKNEEKRRTSVLVTTCGYHVFRCERIFIQHFDEVRVVGVGPGSSWKDHHQPKSNSSSSSSLLSSLQVFYSEYLQPAYWSCRGSLREIGAITKNLALGQMNI